MSKMPLTYCGVNLILKDSAASKKSLKEIKLVKGSVIEGPIGLFVMSGCVEYYEKYM